MPLVAACTKRIDSSLALRFTTGAKLTSYRRQKYQIDAMQVRRRNIYMFTMSSRIRLSGEGSKNIKMYNVENQILA